MSAERDLAEAIYTEMTDDDMSDAAMVFWDGFPDLPPRERIETIIAFVATVAIDTALARRQSEAARTGPWDGGHHFQEEDGYPGSLVPPKRGTP